MSVCVILAGKTSVIAASAFTIAWTHSIERVPWEEDWRVQGRQLVLVEARVKGSGAGMEPAEDAVLENGWWRYRPTLPVQDKLTLAASGATASGWRICAGGTCTTLDAMSQSSTPITISACANGVATPLATFDAAIKGKRDP